MCIFLLGISKEEKVEITEELVILRLPEVTSDQRISSATKK